MTNNVCCDIQRPIHKRRFWVEKFHSDEGPVVVNTHDTPPRNGPGAGLLMGSRANVSVVEVCHKPAARIPKSKIKNKLKEAGCGAERLANPDAQGICHRSFLGPNLNLKLCTTLAAGHSNNNETKRRSDSTSQNHQKGEHK